MAIASRPAGRPVYLVPYRTHRPPAFWDNPEGFDPERFSPERSAGRPRYAYFPFGGGPRQCIGESFAWMEGTLILATFAQRWRFRLERDEQVEPQALITLRPRHGVRVRAQQR